MCSGRTEPACSHSKLLPQQNTQNQAETARCGCLCFCATRLYSAIFVRKKLENAAKAPSFYIRIRIVPDYIRITISLMLDFNKKGSRKGQFCLRCGVNTRGLPANCKALLKPSVRVRHGAYRRQAHFFCVFSCIDTKNVVYWNADRPALSAPMKDAF